MATNMQSELPSTQLQTRACPFCNADILAEVSLCDHCSRFSRPVVRKERAHKGVNVLERGNQAIARWEVSQEGISRTLDRLARLQLRVPLTAKLTVGIVLLLLAVGAAALWLRTGGPSSLGGMIAFAITGGAFLRSQQIFRNSAAVAPTERSANDASLHAFGYDINVAVLQSVALAGVFVWALQSEIDKAWYAAAIVVLLTPLLFRTSRWPFSAAVCAGALGYLFYFWLAYTNFADRIMADQDALLWSGVAYDLKYLLHPYFLVFLSFALVPQFQLLNIGGIGPGGFKGDTSFHLLGSDVPLCFGSSIVLVSLCRAIHMALYAPSWLPFAIFG